MFHVSAGQATLHGYSTEESANHVSHRRFFSKLHILNSHYSVDIPLTRLSFAPLDLFHAKFRQWDILGSSPRMRTAGKRRMNGRVLPYSLLEEYLFIRG